MNPDKINQPPPVLDRVLQLGRELGFDMATNPEAGALLRSLVATKPGGNILELGTGIGASLCWMTQGLTADSKLTSVDNEPKLIAEVNKIFRDPRIELVCQDGKTWIENYRGAPFHLIFADTWPGKYTHLEPTLDLLVLGGIYVIDDLLPQPNWPEGHQDRVDDLLGHLSSRADLRMSLLNCSSGILVATKNSL